MDNHINIELILSSGAIQLKNVPQFNVGLKIFNTSSSKLDFDISKTELWVNGEKNIAWDLAVQNGTLINLSIPGNSSQKVQWPLGDALFPISGNYKLNLRWGDKVQAKEVVVFD
jgi:hypothetical protein